ncbi:Serine hydroxymethyltransferase [Morus notabilis]|uniref:Serine hydroxymethyltransferase n=1 Tax=Morus notabilis TaxID=981085 RepID=W9RNV1_9ROSA|nr:Serine hydroxymethyltransferase [Morus notabilis]
MKKFADAHRREVTFLPSDLVLLKLRPYRLKSLACKVHQKLSPRFYGPFPVLERVGAVAYHLQLPPAARIHPSLVDLGYDLVSGGTDNHLVLVNLRNKGIDGSRVEKVLELVHIAANKNTVPGDVSAMVPGGIRMGTPALTSRGFREEDFVKVAEYFDAAVKLALKIKAESKGTKLKDFVTTLQSNEHFQSDITKLRHEVEDYAKQFPTIGFEKKTMRYRE